MNRSIIRSSTLRAALLIAAAGFAGCSAGYTTGNNANVLLLIAAINGGERLQSDVLKGGGIVPDSVDLAVAIRYKNANLTSPTIANHVIIERYEVHYRRSDGRGVEGQDVPFAISGNLTAEFDVKASGTDPLRIEVVRAQAKLEPPLRNLQSVLGDQGGGGGVIVTMFADITIHGRTISGQAVTATGSLQIDFANWAD